MKIQLGEGDIHLTELHTRLPFKYGIATMTRVPQIFVRLRIAVNGRDACGMASDLLPPKWFTKDAAQPLEAEIQAMLRVIQQALSTAAGLKGDDAFGVWHQLYRAQMHWGTTEKLSPLLVNFGVSLVERALIEAVCRAAGRPFHECLRANQLGVDLAQLHPCLHGLQPADWLPAEPLNTVIARHTIGLADPLTAADIPPDEILRDGLPQGLDDCIQTYGLSHFKIKVSGGLERDFERLRRVASVLNQHAPADYAFTLDGNEQFLSATNFCAYWQALSGQRELQELFRHLGFVEQPLHRDVALQPEVGDVFRAWPERPPIIIDESDATCTSLPEALQLGYAGTSHKNCKGVFKGIANACLLAQRRRLEPDQTWLMSGEDLCNQGPIALLQDLAVMAALGIRSVERNGHHYVAGLATAPPTVQQQILQAHGDLYRASPAGWPSVKIVGGELAISSLNAAPFGVGFVLNPKPFTPLGRWRTH